MFFFVFVFFLSGKFYYSFNLKVVCSASLILWSFLEGGGAGLGKKWIKKLEMIRHADCSKLVGCVQFFSVEGFSSGDGTLLR